MSSLAQCRRWARCAVVIAVIGAPSSSFAQPSEGTTTFVGSAEESYPALRLRGFSDVDYTGSDDPAHDEGFHLGQFVLHLTSPLARKVGFFGELSATPHSDQFTFEVERAFLRYDYNDLFKVSAGRYHTPIGYWNTAYHHGLWLQTTVRRPEQVRFGTTFVPVHFVGVLTEGKVPTGPLGLAYAAGVGNGRGEHLNRGGDAGDANTHRAWMVHLFSRPIHVYGLEAGGSAYRDRLPLAGQPPVGEWIFSGYLVWTHETPELLGEYIGVRHEEAAGPDHDSHAFYVQAAYRLPGRGSRVKPYARYEKMEIASGDPIYTIPDLEVVTAGIRLDFVDLAALKAEYRNERATGAPRVNTVSVQASFTF